MPELNLNVLDQKCEICNSKLNRVNFSINPITGNVHLQNKNIINKRDLTVSNFYNDCTQSVTIHCPKFIKHQLSNANFEFNEFYLKYSIFLFDYKVKSINLVEKQYFFNLTSNIAIQLRLMNNIPNCIMIKDGKKSDIFIDKKLFESNDINVLKRKLKGYLLLS